MIIEYRSNNSGGSWWLKDKDWKNLEKAGWKVVWATKDFDYKDGNYQIDINDGLPKLKNEPNKFSKDGRWLGALAKEAWKKFDSLKEAIEEFEKITKQDTSAEGCNCCGAPHTFTSYDDKLNFLDSCSGQYSLKQMYTKVPNSLREAVKILNKKERK